MRKIVQSMRESSDLPPIEIVPCASYEEYMRQSCNWYNQTVGKMPFLDCPKCKNRGYIAKLNDDMEEVHAECECMVTRRNIEAIRKSGLGGLIERYTFETYNTAEPWQENAKRRAMDYVENGGRKWLFISGQSGCGKKHLCTAVCGRLLGSGRTVIYTVWRNLFHELQSLQFKDEQYRAKIRELQNTDILYIDDFLKSLDQSKVGGELNFAFEVINARYIADKPTIISSELMADSLLKLDTAIVGRIIEKSSGYMLQIKCSSGRNYRLRGQNGN